MTVSRLETTLQPGEELDALVAIKCLQWRHEELPQPGRTWYGFMVRNQPVPMVWIDVNGDQWDKPWPLSTDLGAAAVVLEKLDRDYYDINIQNDCEDHTSDKWYVTLTGQVKVAAPTLPHAICLAALEAMKQKEAA